jgi:two-component system CheB/CheR fusion protein
LFLGKAEMLLNHTAVFDPIDLKRRFFRKTRSEAAGTALSPPWRIYGRDASAVSSNQLRDELILTNPVAQFAVGSDGRLAMVNHRASRMLGLSQRDVGRPFSDLEVSYRPLELRSHLSTVTEQKEIMSLREIEWRKSPGEPSYLDVELVPLLDGSGQILGISVTLTDVTRFRQLQLEVEAANRQLETAYEELQSTNEELETTNEELQSTVEELETTNEELQSTNEELETMNEELQSANDELQITNDQLRDRTVAISELNDFMQTMLGSLDAAVVVIDPELRIQVWTRQAEELWGLREEETVGQQLLSLDSGLPIDPITPWLRSVVSGEEIGVYGQHVQAVNRRGRTVDLRVTVTAMVAGDRRITGALIMFEELSEEDVGRKTVP